MSTAAVRRYWNRVAELGCCVCGLPAQIAHAHNGSIRDRMQEPKAKGKKLPRLDWLVLPICDSHHRSLDADVHRWERVHGEQAAHIDRLILKLGVPVWDLARVGMKTVQGRAV